MSAQARVGEIIGQDGGIQPIRLGRKGATVVQAAHGKYQEAVMRGNVFFISSANVSPTGYVGASNGTPLLNLRNPNASGKVIVILAVSVGIYTVSTAAGVGDFAFYCYPNATLNTGSKTTPVNALTFLASGSSAYAYVNVALTNSTAYNFLMAVATYYWASASSATLVINFVDLGGCIVLLPNNEAAFGISVVPTATTVNFAVFWEEIPYP
jgi:hypothetical protein